MPAHKIPALDRFHAKYLVIEKTGCWLWVGTILKDKGYGQLDVDGKGVLAHRFAYEQLVGPIPPELALDHLCRRRACVNPAHLEVVTQQENLMRGDTSAARNAAKTHCPKGHLLGGENLKLQTKKDGSVERLCRTCCNERTAAWREKTNYSVKRQAEREATDDNAKRRAAYAAAKAKADGPSDT